MNLSKANSAVEPFDIDWPSCLSNALQAIEPIVAAPQSGPRDSSVIVVLGMQGSGASHLTRVLHYLGVDMMGDVDQPSACQTWEQPEIVALQEELLGVIGRPFRTPSFSLPFPVRWSNRSEMRPIKMRMQALIRDRAQRTTRKWGFMDPRTARLLALWSELFEATGVKPIYIWVVRPPAELVDHDVAEAVTAESEINWLADARDILIYAARHKTLVVDSRSWAKDPVSLALKLQRALALPELLTQSEIADCIQSDHVRISSRKSLPIKSGTLGAIAQTVFDSITSVSASPKAFESRTRSSRRLLEASFDVAESIVALRENSARLAATARGGAPLHFVTFHADISDQGGGAHPNTELANSRYIEMIAMLFASALHFHPGSKCTLLTSKETKVGNLDPQIERVIFDIDPLSLMRDRMASQLTFLRICNYELPLLFLDCDILINRALTDVFAQQFDVGLTWRHDKTMPFNGGVIFVNNTNPGRGTIFLEAVHKIFIEQNRHAAKWYGDQTALTEYFGLSPMQVSQQPPFEKDGCRYMFFPCSVYNFSPDYPVEILRRPNNKALIHFKGRRKILMTHYFDAHLRSEEDASTENLQKILNGREHLLTLAAGQTIPKAGS